MNCARRFIAVSVLVSGLFATCVVPTAAQKPVATPAQKAPTTRPPEISLTVPLPAQERHSLVVALLTELLSQAKWKTPADQKSYVSKYASVYEDAANFMGIRTESLRSLLTNLRGSRRLTDEQAAGYRKLFDTTLANALNPQLKANWKVAVGRVWKWVCESVDGCNDDAGTSQGVAGVRG